MTVARPGDTINLVVWRQTPGGAGATGKVAADFTLSSSLDGVGTTLSTAVTEVSTIGIVPNQWTQYKIAVVLGSTAGRFSYRVLPVIGFDTITPDIFQGEIESYDLDAVAALMLTQQGTPAVTSAADSNLGDIVDGDSYTSATLTVPLAKLTSLGVTTLTGLTAEAAVMDAPGGTSYPITCTVVDVNALTFTVGWSTQQHPVLGTANSKVWYIDVQFIRPPATGHMTTLIATTNRYTFTQQWQRDTRTS